MGIKMDELWYGMHDSPRGIIRGEIENTSRECEFYYIKYCIHENAVSLRDREKLNLSSKDALYIVIKLIEELISIQNVVDDTKIHHRRIRSEYIFVLKKKTSYDIKLGCFEISKIIKKMKMFLLLILNFLEGLEVLVSSQNNKAVDNVLERIAQNKNIGIIRIGNEKMIQDNVKEFMPENQSEKLYLSYKKTFGENQGKYKVDLEKLRCLIEISEVDYRLLEGYKSTAEEISYCYKKLNNYLMDLSVLFENINDCKKDIEILMDARAKKYIYISETKKKNIFIRFLRIPISLGVKKDISKLNSDIKEQNKKYDYSVEEYNRISFEFQKQLKDEEFIKYKNELGKIKDKIKLNGVLSMKYALPYDSFNCNFKFENITQCMEDVKAFKKRCLESVENISKLIKKCN